MEFREEEQKQLDRLTLAAHLGAMDRRSFLKTLLAAGVSAAFAVELADQAAMAAENQSARRAHLLARVPLAVCWRTGSPPTLQ
jgi:hypothetical protein